ncbi:MAG: orotidine-5'-phosphate decarboxylase [Desulfobacterales bacterium]|nr:orotidine-5'-phosphate decarboxylase [Desulfobacterales bacterium]MBF0397791.1 orotidine-5'-phosphate decarboxylase [Desulfobacterales bacterium]
MNSKNIPLKDRIIFALDVDNLKEAEKWVDLLGDHINFFKVGLQLFIAEWFRPIDMIIKKGHKVMADLKIFDVPETVKLAVKQLRDRGVTFVTVHGNDPILRAAVEVKEELKILAVTVLTSFDESDMKEMGLTRTVEDLVFIRAEKALNLGCDGIVSSGMEASRLRRDLGDKLIIVTPGIRPGKNIEVPSDDQKRIMSPQEAIKNGADHLVIGRPIRIAKDPIALIKSMQDEMGKILF